VKEITKRTGTIFNRILWVQERSVEIFGRYPWIGWAVWLIFCVNSLVRTTPRRFGSTFEVYLIAAHHFWHGQQIYVFSNLGDYLYWPVSLLVLGPLPELNPTVAAMIAKTMSAAVLTIACVMFVKTFKSKYAPVGTFTTAGVLLMINIPAAWYNFKDVQAQIGMTAFMMLAAVAVARRGWLMASFWLFLSIITKPLSLVMLLLCGATQPRMRIGLALALLAALLLPFAFADMHYVAGEYRSWIDKLRQLAAVTPGQWPYQADFATLLDTVGIDLPRWLQTGLRLAAALGTLALVWRVARLKQPLVFAMAVMLFSACYITLFGPRNEFLSFLVLTPPLTALALLLIDRDVHDQRGWALVIAALVIGFHGALAVDRALKPFLAFVFLSWLIWLTLEPTRWVELLKSEGDGAEEGRSDGDP
jgi:hypothetical protein